MVGIVHKSGASGRPSCAHRLEKFGEKRPTLAVPKHLLKCGEDADLELMLGDRVEISLRERERLAHGLGDKAPRGWNVDVAAYYP